MVYPFAYLCAETLDCLLESKTWRGEICVVEDCHAVLSARLLMKLISQFYVKALASSFTGNFSVVFNGVFVPFSFGSP